MADNLTFEEAMDKLKISSEKIKKDDISLDDAIKAYEDGIKYYNQCKTILENAKQKIEIYTK